MTIRPVAGASVVPEMDASAELPENRLMLAVLEEALTAFRNGLNSDCASARKRFFEAARWFASRDSDWLFSFESICTSLRIEPEYLRAGLRQLERAAFGAPARARPGSVCLASSSDRPRRYRVRA